MRSFPHFYWLWESKSFLGFLGRLVIVILEMINVCLILVLILTVLWVPFLRLITSGG